MSIYCSYQVYLIELQYRSYNQNDWTHQAITTNNWWKSNAGIKKLIFNALLYMYIYVNFLSATYGLYSLPSW